MTIIGGKTLCPFSNTCLHNNTCDRVLKEEHLTELKTSGNILVTYVGHPYCYEIHSTDDTEEDEDFDDA